MKPQYEYLVICLLLIEYNMNQTIGIDIKSNLNLRRTSRCWWNTIQVKSPIVLLSAAIGRRLAKHESRRKVDCQQLLKISVTFL